MNTAVTFTQKPSDVTNMMNNMSGSTKLMDDPLQMPSCGIQQQCALQGTLQDTPTFDVNGAVAHQTSYAVSTVAPSSTMSSDGNVTAYCSNKPSVSTDKMSVSCVNTGANSVMDTSMTAPTQYVNQQTPTSNATFMCSTEHGIVDTNSTVVNSAAEQTGPSNIYRTTEPLPASLAIRLADCEEENLEELLVGLPQPCFVYSYQSDTVVKRADTTTTQTSSLQWTKPQPAIVGPYTPNYVVG